MAHLKTCSKGHQRDRGTRACPDCQRANSAAYRERQRALGDPVRTAAKRRRLSLSQARLMEVLSYDPVTGEFRWRAGAVGRCVPGAMAGRTDSDGYVHIGVDGCSYLAHRLAWLYVNGVWPKGEIDHRFGNPGDNRIAHLREATRFQQQRNMKTPRTNTSGFKGVSRTPNGKWRANIWVENRPIYLGQFPTPEAAHEAYTKAALELHGEFARVA